VNHCLQFLLQLRLKQVVTKALFKDEFPIRLLEQYFLSEARSLPQQLGQVTLDSTGNSLKGLIIHKLFELSFFIFPEF